MRSVVKQKYLCLYQKLDLKLLFEHLIKTHWPYPFQQPQSRKGTQVVSLPFSTLVSFTWALKAATGSFLQLCQDQCGFEMSLESSSWKCQ